MRCPHCGAKVDKRSTICKKCGRRIDNKHAENIKKRPMFFTRLISFILPVFGFILYIIFRESDNEKAKVCFRWSIYGVITLLVVGVLFFFFWIYILINVIT
jgi:uncharacterized membrane protein YvbJ